MTDHIPHILFRKELTQLIRRIERLEGKLEQLRIESMPPGVLYPNRREYQ